MASYRHYARFCSDFNHPQFLRWDRNHKPYTFTVGPHDFLINEEELEEFQRSMAEKPVDFSIHWIIKRPGGRVGDKTYVVRFYNKNSAMLFKLARIV